MSKTLKSAVLIVFILAFLVFAGVLMNRSARMLEHWAYPIEYEDIVKEKAKENNIEHFYLSSATKDAEAVRRFYQRNGYRIWTTVFFK